MTVVNALLRAFYPARFLELSTPLTGHEFARTRTDLCARADLAKYRIQAGTQSADRADLEDCSDTSGALVRALLRRLRNRPKYDVILCDPHHSYANSLDDLRNAWALLDHGGTLVVHDCNPATEEHASQSPTGGIWCGRTFEAFLDFVHQANLPYFTVDADHGIGVVLKAGYPCGCHPFDSLFKTMTPAGRALWDDTSPNDDRFGLLRAHRDELLNIVRQEAFAAVSEELVSSSSDELGSPTYGSMFLRVADPLSGEWTQRRTRTEIIDRYEEMVGRLQTQCAVDGRRIAGLGDWIDQRAKRMEAETIVDGLRLDLAASKEELMRAESELRERAVQLSDVANLVSTIAWELTSMKSSRTFQLRAWALRARLPLVLWRSGAAVLHGLFTLKWGETPHQCLVASADGEQDPGSGVGEVCEPGSDLDGVGDGLVDRRTERFMQLS